MNAGVYKRGLIFAGFVVVFILGFFSAVHFYYNYNSIKVYNPEGLSKEVNIIELTSKNIGSGKVVHLNKDNEVWFYLGDKYYSFRLSEIFPSSQGASLYIDEIPLNIVFNKDQKRKIDLDSDGFYDVSVYLNSVSLEDAVFLFQKIHEKVSAGDNLMFWFENMQGNLSKSVERHNYMVLIFFVLLFIMLLFLLYFSIPYIAHYRRMKHIKERKSYSEVIEYLIDEIEKSKKKDRNKAVRLYNRMRFVYDNLSLREQAKFRKDLEKIKDELRL